MGFLESQQQGVIVLNAGKGSQKSSNSVSLFCKKKKRRPSTLFVLLIKSKPSSEPLFSAGADMVSEVNIEERVTNSSSGWGPRSQD